MEIWPISPWVVLATSSGDPLLDLLLQAGASGILAFVVVAFLRGWIIPQSVLENERAEKEVLRKERDRALELVYKGYDLTQRAIDLSSEKRTS